MLQHAPKSKRYFLVTCQHNKVLSMKGKNLQNTSAPPSQRGAKSSEVAALFVAYVEGKL